MKEKRDSNYNMELCMIKNETSPNVSEKEIKGMFLALL